MNTTRLAVLIAACGLLGTPVRADIIRGIDLNVYAGSMSNVKRFTAHTDFAADPILVQDS